MVGPILRIVNRANIIVVHHQRCCRRSRAGAASDKPSVVLDRWLCLQSISVLHPRATPRAIFPLGRRW